jgi:hypothetical protein
MNKKLSKTFIKHCNACLLTLKGLINRLQEIWKLYISWNLLHKPWKIIWKKFKDFWKKIENFLNNILRNILPKKSLK